MYIKNFDKGVHLNACLYFIILEKNILFIFDLFKLYLYMTYVLKIHINDRLFPLK